MNYAPTEGGFQGNLPDEHPGGSPDGIHPRDGIHPGSGTRVDNPVELAPSRPGVAEAWARRAPALAEWAFTWCVARRDVYGTYYESAGVVKTTAVHAELTLELVVASFRGELRFPLGAYVTSVDHKCKQFVVDIDAHDDRADRGRNWEAACVAAKFLCGFGLHPLVLDSNGAGGYHVRVFFKKPIPAEAARWLGVQTASELAARGFSGIETFPKRGDLTLVTPYGHWVRLPGRHHKRDHWTRVAGSAPGEWLEGERAVERLLAVLGDDSKEVLAMYALASKEDKGAKGSKASRLSTSTRPASKPDSETVRAALAMIPNNDEVHYDTWLNVGLGVNDWDQEEGLDRWIEWSARAKTKHVEATCREKWGSFSPGGGITIGTIFYYAEQAGWVPPWKGTGQEADRGDGTACRTVTLTKGGVVTLAVGLSSRRTSKRTVVVEHAGVGEIFRHTIDLDSDEDRRKYARALDKKTSWPASDVKAVEDGLLALAGDVAKAKAERQSRCQAASPEESSGSADVDYDCPYIVWGGRLCEIHFDDEGRPRHKPLCNFNAWITEVVVLDDGVEQLTRFRIAGARNNGEPLPQIDVSTEDFCRGDWCTKGWDIRAIPNAGQGTKDHIRCAISHLSGEVSRRTNYTHTGWREIGGARVYLHAEGAIGDPAVTEGIQVHLPEALGATRYPSRPRETNWPSPSRRASA